MKIQGPFTACSLLLVVCAPLAHANVIVGPNPLAQGNLRPSIEKPAAAGSALREGPCCQ
jgi:hypothetical protein